ETFSKFSPKHFINLPEIMETINLNGTSLFNGTLSVVFPATFIAYDHHRNGALQDNITDPLEIVPISAETEFIIITGSNETSKCYRSDTLEHISIPLIRQLLLTLYIVTSVFSLMGNIIVIVVQMYGRESKVNIRKYLISLALADILTGV